MVDFMEDSLRIVRWYLDPANQKEATEIASKVTKQPAEQFTWLFTQKDYFRDPNMLPNLDALQKNLDMTTDLGFVKAKVDLSKHVDLSIVKEAAARIRVGLSLSPCRRSMGRGNLAYTVLGACAS